MQEVFRNRALNQAAISRQIDFGPVSGYIKNVTQDFIYLQLTAFQGIQL